jgi:hypothetical protein
VNNNEILVTEAEAHSWVEIYLGEVGWVIFEPTAARDPLEQTQGEITIPPELKQLPRKRFQLPWFRLPGWEFWFSLIGIVGLSAGVYVLSKERQLYRMDSAKLISQIYQQLYRFGRWLDTGHLKSDTLFEFSDKINQKVQDLASGIWSQEYIQGAVEEINQLTHYAVRENYSRSSVPASEKSELLQIWRRLRLRLFSVLRIRTQNHIKDRLNSLFRIESIS